MKCFCILLTAILCANASAQTIRTLGYNTTNGKVVYNGTNTLTFTNGFRLLDGATTIIDLATDAASDFSYGIAVGGAIEFSGTNTTANASTTRSNLGLGATWLTNTNVTNFRTAVGLPLSALTNTSNVTTMRALAGQTNTNTPASGTYQLTNIISIVISNGIIVQVEQP